MRLPTLCISPFTGLLSCIPFLKVLQNKIKINSHIPLGKNGNIHGLNISSSPSNLGTMCNFPHIQVLRTTLTISYGRVG